MRLLLRVASAAAALCACAGASFVDRGGLLWYRTGAVGVPDLERSGWQAVRADGADLAFRKEGAGAIGVRLRCPAPHRTLPLRWESRELWLGIPREQIEQRPLEVDGRPGIEMRAASHGLSLRTVLVRVDACSLDVAQAAPLGSPAAASSFERFLSGIRLPGVLR
jgi:hypothetical protein